MAKEIKLPQISEGVESAQVAEVLVAEGDTIEKDQSIIAVETDKASVEVPSSDSGKVKEIKVKEGDEIKVGDVILVLEEEGEDEAEGEEEAEGEADEETAGEKEKEKTEDKEKEEAEPEKKEEEQKEEPQEEEPKEEEPEKPAKEEPAKKQEQVEEKPKEEEAEPEEKKEEPEEKKEKETEEQAAKPEKEKAKAADKDEAKAQEKKEAPAAQEEEEQEADEVPASPGVRRLARELGVAVEGVEGSGEAGRITEEDVKAHVRKQGQKEEKPKQQKPQPALPDFSQWGEVERKPLSGIRKAIAENTAASWQAVPHVTHFDEADISGIEEYRKENSEKAESAGGKLTITAILVKIAANALQRFPLLNASIDMEQGEVVLKKYIHVGIAVDTEKGLLVPVIRNVDKKTLLEIAVEITELAEKARNQKLSPEEMQGGSFVVSNLGGIGGTNFTPIVYHPQVAILGVAKAKLQPVYIEGMFVPRQVLPLSLSYDHRLIDGAEGARFLRWIGQALEDPYKALLEV